MNERRGESTTLRALAYDGGRGSLQLEFCTRAIYHYYGVPVAVYEALLCAPSKGSYFNRVIRGRFPYALCASAKTGLAGKG
jgi:KTSC domain